MVSWTRRPVVDVDFRNHELRGRSLGHDLVSQLKLLDLLECQLRESIRGFLVSRHELGELFLLSLHPLINVLVDGLSIRRLGEVLRRPSTFGRYSSTLRWCCLQSPNNPGVPPLDRPQPESAGSDLLGFPRVLSQEDFEPQRNDFGTGIFGDYPS